MGSVEIPEPVAGWNPVPGDPDAMVWWDGAGFTHEAVRAGDRWEVGQAGSDGDPRRGTASDAVDDPAGHGSASTLTRREWSRFLRRPVVVALIVGLGAAVWGTVVDISNGKLGSAGFGVAVAVGLAATLVALFRRRTESAVDHERKRLAALRAQGVLTDREHDALVARLDAGVETFLDEARSARREAARTRRASPRWLGLMIALALVGTAVVVLGATMAFRAPDLPMTSVSAPGCTDAAIADFVAPLWVPWLVLVALLVPAVIITTRHGWNDWRMTVLLALGGVAALLTFPGWAQMISAMNCAR